MDDGAHGSTLSHVAEIVTHWKHNKKVRKQIIKLSYLRLRMEFLPILLVPFERHEVRRASGTHRGSA
jgi:hypothetical protein